jgi:radical SAM enzyme (TIGR01210 family)
MDRGKTFQYNDDHDERQPAKFWFDQTSDGCMLFVVFYTAACRWGHCLGCNLPSMSAGRPIGFRSLMAQVDALFAEPEVQARRGEIRHLIVSNNGSVLDEQTFSSTALIYLVAQANIHFPNLSVLTLETRPDYVDVAELEFLARALKEGETPTTLELAVGFEAFDDRIRNKVYKKGLTIREFRECVERVARHKFRLRCYFMFKPVPGMTDAQAIEDIQQAIDYLVVVATEFGCKITMHLNPTYVAQGTLLEEAFRRGEYLPPHLKDVITAVRHAQGKPITLTIGLNDEGLAVDGGSFLRPEEEPLRAALARFNADQDFTALPA